MAKFSVLEGTAMYEEEKEREATMILEESEECWQKYEAMKRFEEISAEIEKRVMLSSIAEEVMMDEEALVFSRECRVIREAPSRVNDNSPEWIWEDIVPPQLYSLESQKKIQRRKNNQRKKSMAQKKARIAYRSYRKRFEEDCHISKRCDGVCLGTPYSRTRRAEEILKKASKRKLYAIAAIA